MSCGVGGRASQVSHVGMSGRTVMCHVLGGVGSARQLSHVGGDGWASLLSCVGMSGEC